MKKLTISLNLQIIPPVMLRGQHVLIVLRNARGEFLLGRKNIYPAGMTRFVGGGIEAGETPLAAAQRELQEETGMVVTPEQFIPLLQVDAEIHSQAGQNVLFTTHVFFLQVLQSIEAQLKASDDVHELVALSPTACEQLIDTYHHLPNMLDPQVHFNWAEYGQLYAFIHQSAFEAVRQLQLSEQT